jgi:hypothetical protein
MSALKPAIEVTYFNDSCNIIGLCLLQPRELRLYTRIFMTFGKTCRSRGGVRALLHQYYLADPVFVWFKLSYMYPTPAKFIGIMLAIAKIWRETHNNSNPCS